MGIKKERTHNDQQNLHIKVKLEQHKPHYKAKANSGVPEA